jgi:hypothetical protein
MNTALVITLSITGYFALVLGFARLAKGFDCPEQATLESIAA